MPPKDKIKLIEERTESLWQRLAACDICPRNCRINRLQGQKGYCGADKDMVVYTAFLHQGEEPGISQGLGSGTIFFSGCSLKCLYCQNHKFSHTLKGRVLRPEELATVMLKLQEKGAANINLVTPTHFLPQILKSLKIAYFQGLDLPLVYNTSGYEKAGIIGILAGIIDIYLADMKYISPQLAGRYSQAPQYPVFNQESVKLMHEQSAILWQGGILKQGLIIRHLALPGLLQETRRVFSWIRQNTPRALVSAMSQYQPYHQACRFPGINRTLTPDEGHQIKEMVEELDLDGWLQDLTLNEELAGVHFSSSLKDLL